MLFGAGKLLASRDRSDSPMADCLKMTSIAMSAREAAGTTGGRARSAATDRVVARASRIDQ
jgi:hypothetical protein